MTVLDEEWAKVADLIEAQAREIERLRTAIYDLMSWFPDKPSPPEWRIRAGEWGADNAVRACKELLEPPQ